MNLPKDQFSGVVFSVHPCIAKTIVFCLQSKGLLLLMQIAWITPKWKVEQALEQMRTFSWICSSKSFIVSNMCSNWRFEGSLMVCYRIFFKLLWSWSWYEELIRKLPCQYFCWFSQEVFIQHTSCSTRLSQVCWWYLFYFLYSVR